MSCTSATAAKSRYFRQTNGAISPSSLSAAFRSPAHGVRLDHGRAFPRPSLALVVAERGRGRDGDRRGRGIRAQAQIDPEDVAVGRALLHQPRHPLRDPDEERLRLDVCFQRICVRIVEDDQVDIARIIQLARAHLAHREHDQAAADLGCRGIGGRNAAPPRLLRQKIADRALRGGHRDIGERRRHAHHRPHAADVAQRNQKRGLGLHAAQQLHRRGIIGRGRHVGAEPCDKLADAAIRVGAKHAQRASSVRADQIEQVGRGLGDALENCAGLRRCRADRIKSRSWLGRQIAQPAGELPPRVIRRKQLRSGDETRRERSLIRAVGRGKGHPSY